MEYALSVGVRHNQESVVVLNCNVAYVLLVELVALHYFLNIRELRVVIGIALFCICGALITFM